MGGCDQRSGGGPSGDQGLVLRATPGGGGGGGNTGFRPAGFRPAGRSVTGVVEEIDPASPGGREAWGSVTDRSSAGPLDGTGGAPSCESASQGRSMR